MRDKGAALAPRQRLPHFTAGLGRALVCQSQVDTAHALTTVRLTCPVMGKKTLPDRTTANHRR